MIVQWRLLSDRLVTHRSFEPTQRVRAIHLCGERPTDLFQETAVRQWDMAYLGGIHGNGRLNVAQVMEILLDDKPADMAFGEFERRLELWLPQIPSSIHGQETLKGFVTGMIEELTERLELIRLREERDHALSIEAAKVDLGGDGMRRMRYERENDRARHAALTELRKLQDMRLKNGLRLAEAFEEPPMEEPWNESSCPFSTPERMKMGRVSFLPARSASE